MPKFTAAVQLTNPASNARVGFLPGDSVPAWALNRIGSHVHDGEAIAGNANDSAIVDSAEIQAAQIIAEAEEKATGIVAKAQAEAQNIVSKAQSEADEINGNDEESEDSEQPDSEESGGGEESGEPDFTQPAPAKRKPGRPRKQG